MFNVIKSILMSLVFLVVGILEFVNRESLSVRAYEYSLKKSRTGLVTSQKWNKGVITVQSIVFILIGFLCLLAIILNYL